MRAHTKNALLEIGLFDPKRSQSISKNHQLPQICQSFNPVRTPSMQAQIQGRSKRPTYPRLGVPCLIPALIEHGSVVSLPRDAPIPLVRRRQHRGGGTIILSRRCVDNVAGGHFHLGVPSILRLRLQNTKGSSTETCYKPSVHVWDEIPCGKDQNCEWLWQSLRHADTKAQTQSEPAALLLWVSEINSYQQLSKGHASTIGPLEDSTTAPLDRTLTSHLSTAKDGQADELETHPVEGGRLV
jgi:hypothetical protein